MIFEIGKYQELGLRLPLIEIDIGLDGWKPYVDLIYKGRRIL